MRYYPLLANLTSMNCLVVGGGEVGLRKIEGLLACSPARVTAVDPAPATPELTALLANNLNFTYMQRPFRDEDVLGQHLVFACTSNRDVNQLVGRTCNKQGVLCNMTDAPEQGDFVLPASVSRGDLLLTVSTSGASPALSKVIRQRLEEQFGPEYEVLTRLLASIRPALLELGQDSRDNRKVFRALASSALPELIRNRDQAGCRDLLTGILPPALHPRIGEWCDDCFQTV